MVRIAQSIGYVGLLAMMGALGSGYDDMGDGMPEASVSVAMASRKQSKSGTVSKPKKSNTMLKVGIGAAIIAAIALIGGLFAYKKYNSNKAEKEKKEKEKKDKENKDKDPDDKGPDDKGPKDKDPKDKDPKGGDDKSGDAAASTTTKGAEPSKGKVPLKLGTGGPGDKQKDSSSTTPLETRPSGAGPPPPGAPPQGQVVVDEKTKAAGSTQHQVGEGGGPESPVLDQKTGQASAQTGDQANTNQTGSSNVHKSDLPLDKKTTPSSHPAASSPTPTPTPQPTPQPPPPAVDANQGSYDKMSPAEFLKGQQENKIPKDAKQTVPA